MEKKAIKSIEDFEVYQKVIKLFEEFLKCHSERSEESLFGLPRPPVQSGSRK